MAKIYARKIHEGAINEKTGEAWKLEDVPMRWREATARELEKYGDIVNAEMKKIGRTISPCLFF